MSFSISVVFELDGILFEKAGLTVFQDFLLSVMSEVFYLLWKPLLSFLNTFKYNLVKLFIYLDMMQ